MEGLGRLFNFVPIAEGVSISLKDAAGVTFFCTGDYTFTLKSQPTSGGDATNLATVTDYYTNASTAGADQWVAATQAAAATVVCADAVAFYVDAADLPSGAEYVEVTGSGLVHALVHDLLVQRTPPNLAALAV